MSELSKHEKRMIESLMFKPQGVVNAFLWAIENIDLVSELCSGPIIDKDIIWSQIKEALEKKDYTLYVLLNFKLAHDEEEKNLTRNCQDEE